MASTRRTARTLLAGACVVPLLAVPGVASAAPPDHAPARGHEPGTHAAESRAGDRPAAGSRRTAAVADSSGRTKTRTTDRPGADAPGRSGAANPGRGGPQAGDDGAARTTSAASTTSSSPARGSDSTDTKGADDRPGRGLGRVVPPGRATDGGGGRQASGGATTPAAPTPTTSAPAAPAAGPAPDAPTAGPVAPAPTLVPPPSFAVTTPSVPTPPAPSGSDASPEPVDARPAPAVLDLDQRLQALLDDVAGSVGRTVPNVLGPIREPLSDLVPTLLLILGTFLVVQRGIGRGLGHVPMAGDARPGQSRRS